MRKAGNRLRVTAQLVNVADGYHLWSERYDRAAGGRVRDPGRDRREHRQGAAGGAERRGEAGHREGARPTTSQAYDYYLRGRQYFHQFRRTGIQFARRMFERAIEIDPSYALAYAGVADCCSFLYMYWDGSKANLEGADSHSRQGAGAGPGAGRGARVARLGAVAEQAVRGGASRSSRPRSGSTPSCSRPTTLTPGPASSRESSRRRCGISGGRPGAAGGLSGAAADAPPPLQGLGRNAEAEAALRQGLEVAEQAPRAQPRRRPGAVPGRRRADPAGRAGARPRVGRPGAGARPGGLRRCSTTSPASMPSAGRPTRRSAASRRPIQNGFGHREWLENDSDLDSLRGDPRFEALLERL